MRLRKTGRSVKNFMLEDKGFMYIKSFQKRWGAFGIFLWVLSLPFQIVYRAIRWFWI